LNDTKRVYFKQCQRLLTPFDPLTCEILILRVCYIASNW